MVGIGLVSLTVRVSGGAFGGPRGASATEQSASSQSLSRSAGPPGWRLTRPEASSILHRWSPPVGSREASTQTQRRRARRPQEDGMASRESGLGRVSRRRFLRLCALASGGVAPAVALDRLGPRAALAQSTPKRGGTL